MNTNDIMESLKLDTIWRSNKPLPSVLVAAIEEGLNERDKLVAELSENNAKKAANTRKLTCNSCDAVISSPVPSDTVVRAWCECPECIEGKPDINAALTHLRAIVDATYDYAEPADAIIEAERWLRTLDATD